MTISFARSGAVLGIALNLALAPIKAPADDWQPDHDCTKPYKPYTFTSQWEIENFRSEVEDYKNCIAEFVEEQQQAIRNHTQAEDDAIEEWNDFVRYELN